MNERCQNVSALLTLTLRLCQPYPRLGDHAYCLNAVAALDLLLMRLRPVGEHANEPQPLMLAVLAASSGGGESANISALIFGKQACHQLRLRGLTLRNSEQNGLPSARISSLG